MSINQINWELLTERLSGEQAVFAIDVAKEGQFALLTNRDPFVSELFKWQHSTQTPLLLDKLRKLFCPVVVVVESTDTYGDAMCYQFRQLGFKIHQASGKRVHDSKEVYDGVPSLHDAKSATIIAKHYYDGLTKPWQELTKKERQLNSLQREYEMHQGQYQRNQNPLEAYLSRHWPQVTYLLALDSVTLESLLKKYGSAKRIAENGEAAVQ